MGNNLKKCKVLLKDAVNTYNNITYFLALKFYDKPADVMIKPGSLESQPSWLMIKIRAEEGMPSSQRDYLMVTLPSPFTTMVAICFFSLTPVSLMLGNVLVPSLKNTLPLTTGEVLLPF